MSISLALGLGVNMGGGPGFTPASLFSGNNPGFWYDPSDLNSMFQDSAGATPVTSVEQPVGKILDKSGNGNHATQGTSANRPTLSARVNLLTKTEQLTDVAWTKTAVSASATAATTSPRGDNTACIVVPDTTSGIHVVSQGVGLGTVPMTFSVYAKAAGYPRLGMRVYDGTAYRIRQTFDLSNGSVVSDGSAAGTPTIKSVGNGWYLCTVVSTVPTGSMGSTSGWAIESLPAGQLVQATFVGDGVSGAYVWGADARYTPTNNASIPVYQRVNTSTDYDTVGFPLYLAFNGTNSCMASTVDLSSTAQASVFAGVQKKSDAAQGTVCELTANAGTTAGGFSLQAPSAASSADFTLTTNGGSAATSKLTTYAAPVSDVVDATLLNTSGTAAGAITPRVNAATPTITVGGFAPGGANFANAAMNIGARSVAATPSLFFNGNLYSLCVVGKTASAAEIASTESYMNGKTRAY